MALVLAVTCRAEDPVTNRLAQLQEQITQIRALIPETTNEVERAHWQERLGLLEQDRKNIEQRLALDVKERTLAEHQSRQADARLRETLCAISTDVSAFSNDLSRIDFGIRQIKVQRGDLERNRRALATGTQPNAEQITDLDQQLRVTDEDIAAHPSGQRGQPD
ncbi:MAG: hypothetical protein NTY53_27385 [Kiritimatiellaeota bacterium]|nr:hypothetical protein [Kiritimatiellota bacterium]